MKTLEEEYREIKATEEKLHEQQKALKAQLAELWRKAYGGI